MAICNSGPRRSDTHSWSPQALGIRGAQSYMGHSQTQFTVIPGAETYMEHSYPWFTDMPAIKTLTQIK